MSDIPIPTKLKTLTDQIEETYQLSEKYKSVIDNISSKVATLKSNLKEINDFFSTNTPSAKLGATLKNMNEALASLSQLTNDK